MIPMGLIINELITYFIQNNYISEKNGSININLKAEKNMLQLKLSTSSEGFINKTKIPQELLEIQIAESLIAQLNGKVSYSNDQCNSITIVFQYL